MPQFVKIELQDKLRCQGGWQRIGALYPKDLMSAKDISAIDDQESLTFAISRADPTTGADRAIVSKLAARQIATVVWDDGTFDERRVALIEDGHGIGATITITANPLLLDLAEGADSSTGKGYVSQLSTCNRIFNFAASGSASTLFTTYVIPASPSWLSLGTIDPTAVIPSITWNRLTPLALALQVRDALRTMNVTCELALRRNGTTDYKLDLVTQVGAGATVPIFHPRTSLRSLRRRIDTTQEATRIFTVGQNDPTGMPGIPGAARWLVTAVDGGAKTLTLADPNGGTGPIGFAAQFATGANVYLQRVMTGRTFNILNSDPVTQKVTLVSVSTFVAGEFVTFRYTEPETNAIVRTSPSPRFAVATLSGTADNVTCSGNPITVNNQHVDFYARVWTASVGGSIRVDVRIGATDSATDKVTGESGAGAFAGVLLTDYVEFIQLDGAGELPTYLEHPSALTTYGMKAGDLTVGTAVGVTNLVVNPWARAWANPANPPDNWFVLSGGGAGPTSKETNPLFTRYGGASYNVDFHSNVVQSPPFFPSLCVGNSRLSARLQIYFSVFTGTHEVDFQLWSAGPDGVSLVGLLGTARVLPTNFVSPPAGYTLAPVGAWITMEVTALDVALSAIPYGVIATVSDTGASTTGLAIGYIDTIEAYQFPANPKGIYEFGDGTVIHQAGNGHLGLFGNPPVAYELAISDLERFDPITWGRNLLTKGGSVRVVDSEIGVDTTVRLLRIERDLLRPQESTVGLATLPKLLTQIAVVST